MPVCSEVLPEERFGMKKNRNSQQNFEHSAVILLISVLLVKLIGAVFKIPLKNLIGTLGFGYFSSAYDLFLPIYALSMAGLPVAVSRIVAESAAAGRYRDARTTFRVAKKAFLVTGLCGFAVMLAALYPYARVTMNDPAGQKYVALCVFAIAPALLFCCIMSAYRGYFEGMSNMIPTAVSDVIEALGKLVLGLAFAKILLNVTGNVAYAAAGALLGITLGTLAGALYLQLRHRFCGDPISESQLASSDPSASQRAIFKKLVLIAVPVVLSSLASNITLLIDTTMVKWQLKNVMNSSADYLFSVYADSIADYNLHAAKALTAADIPTFLYGIRGEAYTLYNLVPTLTTTLGIGVIPVLTTAWVRSDRNQVRRNIETILRTTAFIAFPAGVGMAAIAPQLMKLLYRDVASVQIGSTLLFILGIAAVFSATSVPITSMLQAIGKPMVPVKNIAVGAALKVVVNFLLVGRPEINIKGAPVGTTVCYAYIFFANIFCLLKYSKVRPNFVSSMLKPLVSALACGTAAFLTARFLSGHISSNSLITLVCILVAGVVYLALIFVLRTLSAEDVEGFPKGKSIAGILKKFHLIR